MEFNRDADSLTDSPLFKNPHIPRTLVPKTHFPQNPFTLAPFTLSPKMQKACKNAGKILFFLSLWVSGCARKGQKPCKNAGFFLLNARKHRKNAGFSLLLRTRGSKKFATWPLEMRLRGHFVTFMQDKKTT